MASEIEPVADLINELSKLPGIGEKTATRMAYQLLRRPPEEVLRLSRSLSNMVERVRRCSRCFNYTDMDPCAICTDARRDRGLLCVVEEPQDLMALERTNSYRGLYHVLQGSLSPIDGVGAGDLTIESLLERVRQGGIREVILATNPNVKGETTALYIARAMKELGVRSTRLAHGIPMGGDLEYTDAGTLGLALEGRREIG